MSESDICEYEIIRQELEFIEEIEAKLKSDGGDCSFGPGAIRRLEDIAEALKKYAHYEKLSDVCGWKTIRRDFFTEMMSKAKAFDVVCRKKVDMFGVYVCSNYKEYNATCARRKKHRLLMSEFNKLKGLC